MPTPDSLPDRFRIAVLASGRGSNFQALLAAIQNGQIPHSDCVGIFSDRPQAGALAIGRAAGVPAQFLNPRDFANRESFDTAVGDLLAAVQPDLIVCAGYMRIISASMIERFEGRMINIHPSLLPNYPGLHTHARALADGQREHGASVHVVIPALDAGPVLSQAVVPVLSDDTADSLAVRVLNREHPLLIATVAQIASGRLNPAVQPPTFNGNTLSQPLRLNCANQLVDNISTQFLMTVEAPHAKH